MHGKPSTPPKVRSFAPGRIEFLGNHTDYNGGSVLGAAVSEGIIIEAWPLEEALIILTSERPGSEGVRVELAQIAPLEGKESWANYCLGVVEQLKAGGLAFPHGFHLHIASNLPEGAGLSSSAALELATAYALSGLFEHTLDRKEAAMLCRRAENEFVGMPCGILDQGVSAFGQEDALVYIDCHTLDFQSVPMPSGVHFWIFDSGVKHQLVDSHYATRHAECQKAFELLQGLGEKSACLAHVPSEAVRQAGERLGATLPRARHVTEENERVLSAVERLKAGAIEDVGALLNASHESSRSLFENSTPELDALVDALQQSPNVYGARLTGGGFGGAVMAMCSADFKQAEADAIIAAYKQRFEREAGCFSTRAGQGAGIR